MFCGECGTKNSKGTNFCKECGAKLEETNEDSVATELVVEKVDKNVKSNKKVYIIIFVIFFVLGFAYMYLKENVFNPEVIAINYLDASANSDHEKIYDLLNIEDTEFTTKEKYVHFMEGSGYDFSYDITDVDIDSKTAVVEYDYEFEGGNKGEDTLELKKDGKKFFIFDNWVLDIDSDYTVKKDFEIIVPEGSEVKLDGIDLDKYLSKNYISDTEVVYIIPSIFMFDYELEVTTPLGISTTMTVQPEMYTDDFYVSDYLNVDNLSDDQKDELATKTMNLIQGLYNNIIDKKSFNDVKDSYDYDGIDLDELEDDYEDLYDDLTDYSTILSMTIKKPELSSFSIENDGSILVSIYADYDYEIEYEEFFSDDVVTNELSEENKQFSVYLKYVDGEYRLDHLYYVPSYFSKY